MPGGEVGFEHGFVHGGDDVLVVVGVDFDDGEATAVVGHALVDGQFVAEGDLEGEVVVGVFFLDADDFGGGFYDSGEHGFDGCLVKLNEGGREKSSAVGDGFSGRCF